MAEPYVGAEAVGIQQVVAWLGAGATFLAMGGAAGNIIEGEIVSVPPLAMHAFVFVAPTPWERVDPQTFLGEVQVHVDITWPPYGDLSSPAEAWRRAMGYLSGLRADLCAAAHVGVRRIEIAAVPVRLESTATHASYWTASLTVTMVAGNN